MNPPQKICGKVPKWYVSYQYYRIAAVNGLYVIGAVEKLLKEKCVFRIYIRIQNIIFNTFMEAVVKALYNTWIEHTSVKSFEQFVIYPMDCCGFKIMDLTYFENIEYLPHINV